MHYMDNKINFVQSFLMTDNKIHSSLLNDLPISVRIHITKHRNNKKKKISQTSMKFKLKLFAKHKYGNCNNIINYLCACNFF